MSDKKIIAVTGATGAQGGGLVRAILADPEGGFTARAITRNPDSEAATALRDQGVEVVQADLDDEAGLRRAFAGAHGAFCVTNFWEHFDPEREKTQAWNLARAARAAGVQHAIWSTLEDVRRYVAVDDDRIPTLAGGYKVPHMDAKGEANELFREAGVPTTYLHTSFYWDNMITFGMGPARDEDGRLALTLPIADAKLPSMAASDIGACAYGIFREGGRWIGRNVGVAGGHLSGDELAAGLTTALGEPVYYNAVSPAAYGAFGFPGAGELASMFQFKVEFEEAFRGARDLETSRRLNPGLTSYESWLEENADRMPVPVAVG
ncbi:MAG TPA: NmrA/HSCARG family protein [Solirubrobacteraceae bacterium]|nr:NmrA/HSCARG family protein [Solirubrobacteraceae bacterium]